MAESTYHSYIDACELYLKPALGHRPLAAITSSDVRDLHAAMRKINLPAEDASSSELLRRLLTARATWHGRRWSAKPLSESRILRVHAVLSAALGQAVADGVLARNPATNTRPRPRRGRPLVWTPARVERWKETGEVPRAVMVWTPELTGRFLDAATTHRLYPLFLLTALTGLRRSEILRLTWAETDLHRDVITVVAVSRGRPSINTGDWPKSEAGERAIPIAAECAAALRTWRTRQIQERLVAGTGWHDNGLVFSKPDGEPLTPGVVSWHFRQTVRRNRIPPVRFHDLRHGMATTGLAAGVPMKVISEILGHARDSFTADTYTSVIPQVAADAAEAIAAAIPHTPRGTT